ncbi:MAG: Xaa-Pro peptidase family protein [Actinomycetota bacterium]|nr:Xaa-Pro peptidase family protein [Actinomycetota bacterium]
MFAERMDRVRSAMVAEGVDVVLLSVGAELPWLCGYEAMPLERLTMLVVPRDGDATLVIPRLEAARVVERPEVFGLLPWGETEDPVAEVAKLASTASSVAVGDKTWATFVLGLQEHLPSATFAPASRLLGPLRARKDDAEIAGLRAAGAAADKVAAQLQGGEIALVGRTEADVSADLSRRLIAEGHDHVNFAIVGSAANGASPHHHASSRVIGPGEPIVCDFGGSFSLEEGLPGYCSDITRTIWTGGEPSAEFAEAYAVLHEAQAAAVAAVAKGLPCQDVDRAARRVIDAAGYGDRFIHRTGHGIGIEEHEDPYIVEGNDEPLEVGHAFSIEPGIYTDGRWGMRLEDIVVCGPDGADPMNKADHGLAVVDA